MKKIQSAVFTFLFLGCAPLWALQQADDTPLPLDPTVTIKTLENGFTYYIRKNAKPENRMELRLVVNAGSIQEEDDQQGLAHFLEHMAFNGTKNFKKQELVDYLQSVGMRFGADLNAYTGFTETVYQLQIPTDDKAIMEKAFLILEDWAHQIVFDEEEVVKERGVVVEEWRGRRGAQTRIQDKQFPILFKGSRYADRIPIGKLEVISNATVAPMERFYRDWYRPDLMAVIAVGDFDPDTIEALILKHFQPLPKVEKPRQKKPAPVPDHEGTLFSIETDPELTRSMVQLMYKQPEEHTKTLADYRRNMVDTLYQAMLNQRLSERAREANPPYVFGFSSKGNFVRDKSFFMQGAMVKENGFEEGTVALLVEGRRAKQFGFTQTELDRVKKDTLRGYERAYNERDKTNSSRFVSTYMGHFLAQTPMVAIEDRFQYNKTFLPGITLEEVNRVAESLEIKGNRIVMISAPKKEGLEVPNPDGVLEILKKAEAAPIEAYRDEVSNEPLLAKKPTGGKVVSEKRLERLQVTEWELSNGVRLVLKPTDFKNDEIRFTAFSPGGTSLVDESKHIPAMTADFLVDESGIAGFDIIQLEKMMAGKLVSVSPYIGETTEGINGRTTPEDLETLMQLIYMYFTAPRIDEKAVQSTKSKWTTAIENRDSNPGTVFNDEIRLKLYQNHPRRQPITVASLQKLNGNTSLDIYRDRFADAGDFTFIFVGNFDLEKFKPLAAQYLGSLPSKGRKETWKDIGVRYAEGAVEIEVKKGLEPKSNVQVIYTGEETWSSDNRYAMNSMIEGFRIKLYKVLREEMSGVYGVGLSGSLSNRPRDTYRINVSFSCDPDKLDTLLEALMAEIEKLKKEGLEEEYITKVRETQLRRYELGLKQNGFWLNNLDFTYGNGLDPTKLLDFEERVKTLSAELIRDAAKMYFGENRVVAKLLPQETKGGTPKNSN